MMANILNGNGKICYMTDRWDKEPITKLHITELAPFAERAAGRQRLLLVARELRDGSPLTMPAMVLSDGGDRPRMVLLAGQHGNEWNGPWVLHKLANGLDPIEIRGTLVILPVTNPLAFNEASRVSAADGIDLNRTYGGGNPRKPTEHLGQVLWSSVFSHTDYLVDLHSGGPGEYLPFAAAPNGVDIEMAQSLNLPFIHLPGTIKAGHLVHACQQSGVHAVLVEFGGGRSLDMQYHQQVVDGLKNLMRSVGMLDSEPLPGTEPYIFRHKDIVSSPCPGFFDLAVELGQRVREGDRLGFVTPILSGSAVEVKSPRDGIAIYVRRELSVGEYDSLVHIV